jgi:hypothetical protein
MRKILLSILFLAVIQLSAHAQADDSKHWQPGYYYDNDGLKHTGFISYFVNEEYANSAAQKFFLFKNNPDEIGTRIFAGNITSFVVARDSFVVSDARVLNETPFLQVAVNNNPLKLYIARVRRHSPEFGVGTSVGFLSIAGETSFPYTKEKYYYGKNPDNLTELTRKDFIDVMSQVMADKPEVVTKIQKKDYRYGDMKDLLVYYDTGKEPR